MLAVLFASSGAAGLVDQVCFSKYLTYILGSTAYAVSAVLAAFMAGLALGAVIGGRLSVALRRHVAAYGVAELCVAGAVALAPLAFTLLTPLYVSLAQGIEGSLWALSFCRWLLAMMVVVLPTVAMGATLPIVSPALGQRSVAAPEERRRRERRLATLYAANTLGGALGALGAAYFVLPALGIATTLYVSAAVSAVVGVTALFMSSQVPATDDSSAEPAVHPDAARPPPVATVGLERKERRVLAGVACLSGFVVFTAEVVSTHLLAVIIGNSAYAFGLILAVFLACLFGGAAVAPRCQRRFGRAALPLSLALSATAVAATMPLWDSLPLIFAGLGEHISSFEGREAMRALVAFAILVLPVTLMGLTFPLLLQRVATHREVGALVGRLTALNTIGAVAGALAAGYVILPVAGSQGSFVLVSLVFAAAAMALTRRGEPLARPIALLAAAAAIVALVVPPWNPQRLTAGTNVYFDSGGANDEILYLSEDVHGGVTTVTRRRDGVLTLYTNGKFQGNTGWEMNAQRYFAHYPTLFVRQFDSVLVIGLGTGTTLGTLAAYPWNDIDVVEISPSIAEAADAFFSAQNSIALDDPRVDLHLDDARNWLLVQDERFDLISIELSSVWFAGAANLYSREFYELARAHLEPGGVFQQWVQLHHIYDDVFATILNTLRSKFAHVALFYGGGQGILVASDSALRWDPARARRLNQDPRIAGTLPGGRSLTSLTGDILMTGRGLDEFLDDTARRHGIDRTEMISTDDNVYLEYATPRGNVLPWHAREQLVARLHQQYRDAGAIAALEHPLQSRID